MSIPFNQDTSTQLTYTSFPYTITNIDNYASSNYANTLSLNNSNYTAAASNLLKSLIDTTNTNLSTNYYNKLSTDTLLNTKEAILSFTAPLTRSTNTIGINLSSYYTKTETNTNISTAQTNNSNYTDNVAYVLNSRIDSKQNILAPATTLLGTGGSITGINYNTVINKPTYTSPLSSNATTNNISIDLSSYSTTGNDANYLKLTGGTMTGAITNNSTTASGFRYLTITHIDTRQSHIPFNDNKIYLRANVNIDGGTDTLSFGSRVQDNLIYLYGTDYGLGINANVLRYNCPATAVHKFYSGTTNTATIGATGTITATAFSGDGANITNVPYSSITGKPTYFPIDPAIYYTQTQINANITTASNALQGYINTTNTNLTTTNTNLTIAQTNNSNYSLNISNIITTRNAINLTNSSNYASNVSNVLLINYNSLNTTTNTNISNYASNISNVLLINYNSLNTITNTNSSNYASNVSNVIITNTNATYLKLAGGTLTGALTGTTITAGKVNCSDATGVDVSTLGRNLNIVGVAAVMRIWRNDGTNSPSIDFMSGPTTSATSYTWFWDMYIGAATNFYAIRDRRTGGGNPIRLLIDTNGNIGIGTDTPSSKLTINNIVSDRGLFDHSGSPLTITHQTPTSTAAINDPLPILHLCRQGTSGQAYGARATFNLCRYEINSVNSRSRLDISLANDGYDNINIMSIRSDGRVGIGTTNPQYLLDLYSTVGNNNIPFIRLAGGGGANNQVGIIFNPWGGRSGLVATKIYGIDDGGASAHLCFATAATTQTTEAVERMRIQTDGNVGIGVNNPVSTLEVNGKANIHNGSRVGSAFMQSGSLTIGGTNANYGGQYYTSGNWTGTNTAGLLMECSDNTEIAIHDSSTRIASLMYYEGAGTNRITIGRDMGWGTTTSLLISGSTSINSALAVNGTLSISSSANITGNLTGSPNVSKRAIFQFTPTLINLAGTLRNTYTINLSSYMNALDVGWGVQYTCLVHIWTNTADYGLGNDCESMTFHVSISNYAGGKNRIVQVINNSFGSTINFTNYYSIYYNGYNGSGGASTKVCVIENISSN